MKTQYKLAVLAIVVTLTATIVRAATGPEIVSSTWMLDPLFNGTPGDTTGAVPGAHVDGYWWRDTTHQNALAQHTIDNYPGSVLHPYANASANIDVYVYAASDVSNMIALMINGNYWLFGCGGSDTAAATARSAFETQISGFNTLTLTGIFIPEADKAEYLGCPTWVTGIYQDPLPVYVSYNYIGAVQAQTAVAAEQARRQASLNGQGLAWSADGFLGLGQGYQQSPSDGSGILKPNIPIDTGSTTTYVFNGVPLYVMPFGAADDSLSLYLPQYKVLITGNLFNGALPDASPLGRAGQVRGLDKWIKTLTTYISLTPNMLISTRALPFTDSTTTASALTAQRDVLQYIHTETLRRINLGDSIDTIAATLQLSDALAANPYTQEFQKSIASLVKGDYAAYFGWFSGDPVDLMSNLTRKDEAVLVADLAGGTSALIEKARLAEVAAETQTNAERALYLAQQAYLAAFASPDATPLDRVNGTRLYAQALRKAAYMQMSAENRNYLLTAADGLSVMRAAVDFSKDGAENAALPFSAADFSSHYVSSGSAALATVKITSLPAHGQLALISPITTPITAGQEITLGALGGLIFLPESDWFGSTSFTWNGSDGTDFTGADASVTITTTFQSASMIGHVALEKRGAAGNPRWITPLYRVNDQSIITGGVRFYEAGTTNLVGVYTATTDANGYFTVSMQETPPGQYDVVGKGANTLGSKRLAISLPPSGVIDFGTLRVGDSTADEHVNGADVSYMVPSFLNCAGDVPFRPHGDTNVDGCINGADISALIPNFLMQGPITYGVTLRPAADKVVIVGASRMALSRMPTSLQAGDVFTVAITVDTGASNADTVDAYLNFDATTLEAVDEAALNTAVIGSAALNTFDNVAGTINLSASRYAAPWLRGAFTVATVTLCAKVATDGPSVQLVRAGSRNSDLYLAGESLQASLGSSGYKAYLPIIER